jgi:hypothetical protein
MTRRIADKTWTAVMARLIVWKNGERVGYAYALAPEEGRDFTPSLFSNEGGQLDADWYTLQFETEFLVVVNETIQ